jgi:hypothetical protein
MRDVNLDVIESRGSLEQSSAVHHPMKHRNGRLLASKTVDSHASHASIRISDSSALGHSNKGIPSGSQRGGLPPIGQSKNAKMASNSMSRKSFESEL